MPAAPGRKQGAVPGVLHRGPLLASGALIQAFAAPIDFLPSDPGPRPFWKHCIRGSGTGDAARMVPCRHTITVLMLPTWRYVPPSPRKLVPHFVFR
jgi:hypothetical protein